MHKHVALGSMIWTTYCLPVILYACEAVSFTTTDISQLSFGMNDYMRKLLQSHCCTPIQGLLGECSLFPLDLEICKWQLNYFYYVRSLPNTRLVRISMDIQNMELSTRLSNAWFLQLLNTPIHWG